MKGYLKNPAATEKAFAGGWFHTGDLAVMESDRYVKIKDRSKDIIISGGENISSIEVEKAISAPSAAISILPRVAGRSLWGEADSFR
jgi:fatty-acyl-CoA synthase